MSRWAIRVTDKQRSIMRAVVENEATGEAVDITKLIEITGHTASLQAMQISIRFLEKHEMINRVYEIRRGRKRMVLYSTELGRMTFGGPVGAAGV